MRLMAACAVAGVALSVAPAFGVSADPVNLADLVRKSGQIVFGTVTEVTQGIDASGLPYTQIELAVDETLRGVDAATLTFRQFGLQNESADSLSRSFFKLTAVLPRYAEGERVMLFLTETSAIGFRTTVGFDQGRFILGLGTLKNGANNAGLFHDVDLSKARLDAKELLLVSNNEGELDADTFVAFVRRAVRENWWN
jgi:hypothetical protein